MRRVLLPSCLVLILAGLVLGLGLASADAHHHGEHRQPASATAVDEEQPAIPGVLDHGVTTLAGGKTHLSQYYGDVVLIVNTASKCGLTPQYEQLQALHESGSEKGLSILGFPANNFGKQEPGTDKEISVFCQENYGVEFDMFSKISVKGDDQHPLYAFLTSKETNPEFAGDIRWNFDKFLVSRQGVVIARFSPRTKPDSKEVVEAIKAAMKQPVPDDVEAVRAIHAKDAEGAKDAE